jgi:hypothetical protein
MVERCRCRQDAGEPRGRVGADGVEGGEPEVKESGEADHHVEPESQENPYSHLLNDEVHPELLVYEFGNKEREDDHGHDQDHAVTAAR